MPTVEVTRLNHVATVVSALARTVPTRRNLTLVYGVVLAIDVGSYVSRSLNEAVARMNGPMSFERLRQGTSWIRGPVVSTED